MALFWLLVSLLTQICGAATVRKDVPLLPPGRANVAAAVNNPLPALASGIIPIAVTRVSLAPNGEAVDVVSDEKLVAPDAADAVFGVQAILDDTSSTSGEVQEAGHALERAMQGAPSPTSAAVNAGPQAVLHDFLDTYEVGRPWKSTVPLHTPQDQAQSELLTRLADAIVEKVESGYKLLDQFAHEVGNLVRALASQAEVIQKAKPLRQPQQETDEAIDGIETIVPALVSAATQFRSMAAVRGGKAMSFEKNSIADTFIVASKAWRAEAQRKRIAITFQLEEDFEVLADKSMMSLVAQNLIGNAVKYTPEGGRVTIGTMRDPNHPDRAIVYIEDTGIGIAAEDQVRIFHGHRTEEGKRFANGTGVGLALVGDLVKAHGTDIHVQSEIGKGSRFSISLPLWQELPSE
jgi:signal transduction histidine kinase